MQVYLYTFDFDLAYLIEPFHIGSVILWKWKKWDKFAPNAFSQNLEKMLLELKSFEPI